MLRENQKKSKVSLVGLGYIGLPTAALIADAGFAVEGTDISQKAVDSVDLNHSVKKEPGLADLVKKVMKNKSLSVRVGNPKPADVFIIAVPTPLSAENMPDLSAIADAANKIALVIKSGNLVILESTSPVGTSERLKSWILNHRPDLTSNSFFVAYCPERVLPGNIVYELIMNDRIVGGVDDQSTQQAVRFYKTFTKGNVLTSNSRTAELAKLSENSYRDLNIAFANELNEICEKLNIDIWKLLHLTNKHPRVNILKPGPGVGGHCIAVDPWFIVESAQDESRLITLAREVNDDKPIKVANKILSEINKLKLKNIACLGLSYKANVDDLRESPSVKIVSLLAERINSRIYAVEPNIASLPIILHKSNICLSTLENALEEADCIVILVEHEEFLRLSKDNLSAKKVFDICGLFDIH